MANKEPLTTYCCRHCGEVFSSRKKDVKCKNTASEHPQYEQDLEIFGVDE